MQLVPGAWEGRGPFFGARKPGRDICFLYQGQLWRLISQFAVTELYLAWKNCIKACGIKAKIASAQSVSLARYAAGFFWYVFLCYFGSPACSWCVPCTRVPSVRRALSIQELSSLSDLRYLWVLTVEDGSPGLKMPHIHCRAGFEAEPLTGITHSCADSSSTAAAAVITQAKFLRLLSAGPASNAVGARQRVSRAAPVTAASCADLRLCSLWFASPSLAPFWMTPSPALLAVPAVRCLPPHVGFSGCFVCTFAHASLRVAMSGGWIWRENKKTRLGEFCAQAIFDLKVRCVMFDLLYWDKHNTNRTQDATVFFSN